VPSEGVTLSRRALVLGGLLLFLVGLAAKTLLFPTDRGISRAPQAAPAVSAGPARVEAPGVPVGFAHDQRGALAAAVAYVQLGDVILSVDSDAGADVLRRVSSRAAGDAFVQSELAGFTQLQNALARGTGPARLRVGVVATRVDAFAPDRARVRLWRVAVLSRDGMTNPGEQWATVMYDLVWEDGDWKIWSETVAPGPSPSPTDARLATPQELDASLAGFSPFTGGS
jgi:hypothetical protein